MPRIRLHIHLGADPIGPGKVQRLEAIREHGSISAAARPAPRRRVARR